MTMCIFGPINHEINFLEKTFIAATINVRPRIKWKLMDSWKHISYLETNPR
jgi:hypothetical protein